MYNVATTTFAIAKYHIGLLHPVSMTGRSVESGEGMSPGDKRTRAALVVSGKGAFVVKAFDD